MSTMLELLNHYQHGFVATPVILACKQHGLFDILSRRQIGWFLFPGQEAPGSFRSFARGIAPSGIPELGLKEWQGVFAGCNVRGRFHLSQGRWSHRATAWP